MHFWLPWRMGSGRCPCVRVSAHILGRMFMQPRLGTQLKWEKILLQISSVVLATPLCLSVTHSSTCKESSKSSACGLLMATRSSIFSVTGSMTTVTRRVRVVPHPTQLVPSPPGSIAALLWDAPAACSKNKRNPKIVIDPLSDEDNYI